jgi:putative ABC transport system substrate-binding protein
LSAQSSGPRRIGLILLAAPAPRSGAYPLPDVGEVFVAALKDRGWILGRNLTIESRTSAAEPHRAVDLARELLAQGAEILVVAGSANAVAARRATRTTPIVMLASGYPVESGLAKTLARPGGNVTGLRVYAGEVFGKHVDLANEMVPSLRHFGVFWGYTPPAFPEIETRLALGEMQHAADARRVKLHVWQNSDAATLREHLQDAAKAPIQAVLVTSGGPQVVPAHMADIATFCESRRLPTMCDIAGVFFQTAGVLAYSVDYLELGTRGAAFVDRILRGADPAELPIEQPTRFLLLVNTRRAKALGIDLPPSLLARADRVIE